MSATFRILITLVSLLTVLPADLVAEDSLAVIRRRGTLRWGADREGGGPFVFHKPGNPEQLVGFESEIASLIAAHIGVQAQFVQGQWDKLPDMLDRGDFDIVLNGFEYSEERAAVYGTTTPYYLYELQLLVRRDNTTIGSWDDLRRQLADKGGQISLLGGAAAEKFTTDYFGDDVDLALFDGVTDAMRATELGADNIIANVQDLPIWNFYSNAFPNLRAVGSPVGQGFYVGLIRRSETTLLAAANEALLEGRRSGRLQNIFARYGMWNSAQARYTQDLLNSATQSSGSESTAAAAATAAASASQPMVTAEPDPLLAKSASPSGLDAVRERGWLLVQAATITVALSCLAMPLAIGIGLSAALLRLYGNRVLAKIAGLYVEVVRGTPLVLQLYVIYFLIPEFAAFLIPGSQFSISAFWSAVLGLAMNYSAYEAEIYRAGLQAVPKGQMEAAMALGMPRNLAIRRILIPQATRIVIPPVTNDFIALFKDTAACSVITVVELSKEYYIHARDTQAVVSLGLLTAFLYLAMSYPLSVLAGRLEKYLGSEAA
ncbi:MAG TPA: polar amino acid ABC transporter permease [Planctomycetaceae bacterium]|nr:polar amino acid ABC transporter permease [Planctomycetaceae bacterium]HBC62005.1 polar amino acid ABC transporter permease [Planctomycetaceae bacterium]